MTAGALACAWRGTPTAGAGRPTTAGPAAARTFIFILRYELVPEPCADQNASYVRPPPIPIPGLAVPGVDAGGAGDDALVTEGGGTGGGRGRGRGMDVEAVMMERSAASCESTSSVGCIGSKGSWDALFEAHVCEEEGVVEVEVDVAEAECEEEAGFGWVLG